MNADLFSQVNWLAVLIGALAYFFLGAIWYSALFRNAWIKATGVNANDPNARKGFAGIMIASFITILITSYRTCADHHPDWSWRLDDGM
jgi:hypothetical protein